MTLNGVMAITLRYFIEFGKPVFQHITASARKKESSRSLSRLLMSFLFIIITEMTHQVKRIFMFAQKLPKGVKTLIFILAVLLMVANYIWSPSE